MMIKYIDVLCISIRFAKPFKTLRFTCIEFLKLKFNQVVEFLKLFLDMIKQV